MSYECDQREEFLQFSVLVESMASVAYNVRFQCELANTPAHKTTLTGALDVIRGYATQLKRLLPTALAQYSRWEHRLNGIYTDSHDVFSFGNATGANAHQAGIISANYLFRTLWISVDLKGMINADGDVTQYDLTSINATAIKDLAKLKDYDVAELRAMIQRERSLVAGQLTEPPSKKRSKLQQRYDYEENWKRKNPSYNPEKNQNDAAEMRAAYARVFPDDSLADPRAFRNARNRCGKKANLKESKKTK